jgi:hypothetical protein
MVKVFYPKGLSRIMRFIHGKYENAAQHTLGSAGVVSPERIGNQLKIK